MDSYHKELKDLYTRLAIMQGSALSGGVRMRKKRAPARRKRAPKKGNALSGGMYDYDYGMGFYKGVKQKKSTKINPWVEFEKSNKGVGKDNRLTRTELKDLYREEHGLKPKKKPANRYRYVSKNAKDYYIQPLEYYLNTIKLRKKKPKAKGEGLSGGLRKKRPSEYNLFVKDFARRNPGLGRDMISAAAAEWRASGR